MNKRSHINLFLLAICIALAGFSMPAMAELLTLVAPADKDYRGPRDAIELRLGQDMPADLVPYLRLELDAIDVTDFIQQEGQRLLFLPQAPIEPGVHELRVVAVLPDGTIEEAAIWSVEIRASRDLQVASVNSNISLQAMQRVSDDLENPPQERQQGQGGAVLDTRHANDGWEVTSHAEIIYNSQRDQNLNGKALDLTNYQIKQKMEQTDVVLGHQVISPGSLVLSEFSRRGLSASFYSEQQRFQATGFSTRTEEITGHNNLIGLEDSDNVTNGVVLTAFPLSENLQQLAIAAIHLDGRGNSEGVAQVFNEDVPDQGGSASAIIIDSYPGDQAWRLRGEYAVTTFDFDGENTGFDAEDDDAYTVSVGYDVARDTSRDSASDSTWNINLTEQRVGPWFYSLGNTAVTTDRKTTQLSGTYQALDWGVNGVVSLGEDNVDGIEGLPTTAIDTASMNLVYTPQPDVSPETGEAQTPGGGLFSNPSYSLSLNINELNQIFTPAGYTGDDVNSRYHELALAATFTGADWYWSLNQSWINQDDKVFADNVSDTLSTGLESQFSINQYFTLSPVLQRSVTNYTNTSTETRSWLAGMTMNLNYPKDWSNSLSYTVNREVSSDNTFNSKNRIAQMMLQWNYSQASESRAGVSFFTSASHQQLESNSADTGQYQVFVGVNVVLPATF